MQTVFTALVVLTLVFAGTREFKHMTEPTSAVITPQMNADDELGTGVGARVHRLLERTTSHAAADHPKLIALTFDDGPYPMFTPLLLDELHALNVPATFFLIGRDAEQWPELAQRIEADGNEIADHTYSHPNLDQETPAQVRDEITRGRDVLWSLVHDPSVRTMMRPPHGRYTVQTLQTAQQMGYDVVLWTDDTGDWRTVTAETIENGVVKNATSPDIVLMHSGKLATVQAIPAIVDRFRRAGYTFVTAGELLRRVTPYAVNHAPHDKRVSAD
ncbi:MAG: polysaccharide deacetylase family protein [Candidatus Eremiobacteraeota bacterium]|nr:polysaccharide deacetylase family protein [Candidatus Eremiobacteraeota bacterium]